MNFQFQKIDEKFRNSVKIEEVLTSKVKKKFKTIQKLINLIDIWM
jgi:hypothetical protein